MYTMYVLLYSLDGSLSRWMVSSFIEPRVNRAFESREPHAQQADNLTLNLIGPDFTKKISKIDLEIMILF